MKNNILIILVLLFIGCEKQDDDSTPDCYGEQPESIIFTVSLCSSVDKTDACGYVAKTELYHDGKYAWPEVGDVIYNDFFWTEPFDGKNEWHKMNFVDIALIDSNGNILDFEHCPN